MQVCVLASQKKENSKRGRWHQRNHLGEEGCLQVRNVHRDGKSEKDVQLKQLLSTNQKRPMVQTDHKYTTHKRRANTIPTIVTFGPLYRIPGTDLKRVCGNEKEDFLAYWNRKNSNPPRCTTIYFSLQQQSSIMFYVFSCVCIYHLSSHAGMSTPWGKIILFVLFIGYPSGPRRGPHFQQVNK